SGISAIRQGKHFEIEVDDPAGTDPLERVRELAGTLLANPVIEDFTVRLDD
ncbi:MAG TPA: phosphoribosylformylglycinamidine synthase subunit PurS, partial [Mycobacteriales bacterium]|nr:phosphoribosylformylglycinamidine synthase subunit PurS [Mycobacteriales bacterium]